MTSKVRIAFATLGLFALTGLGCGDDNGTTGPSPSSLIGTWDAVKMELVSGEDPSHKLDFIADGNTFTLTLHEQHVWEMLVTAPGQPPVWSEGTWSLSRDILTITDGPETLKFKVRCDGSTMTLTADVTWDHDLDGTAEPAKETIVLVK